MSQSKSEAFNISAIVTFDDQNFPQAVTVSNYGGLPSNSVRSIAQEALDRNFGLTSLRHGYVMQLSPSEEFEEGGTEHMVFEVHDLNANRRIARANGGGMWIIRLVGTPFAVGAVYNTQEDADKAIETLNPKNGEKFESVFQQYSGS